MEGNCLRKSFSFFIFVFRKFIFKIVTTMKKRKYITITYQFFLVTNFFLTYPTRKGNKGNSNNYLTRDYFYGNRSCLEDSIKAYTQLGNRAIKDTVKLFLDGGFIERKETKRTGVYFLINIGKIRGLCDKMFKRSAHILVNIPIDKAFVRYTAICGTSEFSTMDWIYYQWTFRRDNFLKSEKNVKEYAGFYMSPKTIAKEMRKEGLVWVTDETIMYFFDKIEKFTNGEFHREHIGRQYSRQWYKTIEKYPAHKLRGIHGNKMITNIPSKKFMLSLIYKNTRQGDSRKGDIALQKSKGVSCKENKLVNRHTKLCKLLKTKNLSDIKDSTDYYWKVLSAPSYRMKKKKVFLERSLDILESRYERKQEERLAEMLENHSYADKFFGLSKFKFKLKYRNYYTEKEETYTVFKDDDGILKETFSDARCIGRRHYKIIDGRRVLVRKVFKCDVSGGYIIDREEYISRSVLNDFKFVHYTLYGKKKNRATYNFEKEFVA